MSMFTATWVSTEKSILINAQHVLAVNQMDDHTRIWTTVPDGKGGTFNIAVREKAAEIEGRISTAS